MIRTVRSGEEERSAAERQEAAADLPLHGCPHITTSAIEDLETGAGASSPEGNHGRERRRGGGGRELRAAGRRASGDWRKETWWGRSGSETDVWAVVPNRAGPGRGIMVESALDSSENPAKYPTISASAPPRRQRQRRLPPPPSVPPPSSSPLPLGLALSPTSCLRRGGRPPFRSPTHPRRRPQRRRSRHEAAAEGGGQAGAAQCRLPRAEAPRTGPPPQLHRGRRAHRRADS